VYCVTGVIVEWEVRLGRKAGSIDVSMLIEAFHGNCHLPTPSTSSEVRAIDERSIQ
jgi:hypothetical protein